MRNRTSKPSEPRVAGIESKVSKSELLSINVRRITPTFTLDLCIPAMEKMASYIACLLP